MSGCGLGTALPTRRGVLTSPRRRNRGEQPDCYDISFLYTRLRSLDCDEGNPSQMNRLVLSIRRDRLRSLLRQLRLDAGLRQIDLARLLDEPQPFVSRYETGERQLDIAELDVICQALDTTLDKVIADWQDRYRE